MSALGGAGPAMLRRDGRLGASAAFTCILLEVADQMLKL
jgi:hypothetical protein